MRKFNLISLSLFAMLSLIGCGSSGSSSSETGTGYYVDSPVEGVDYTCGSQKGKTSDSGKFIFEKGKGCTFSLAGVKLRETSSSQLTDGGKVFEDNDNVARFLQSLDNDGNPGNGIFIHDDVRNELPNALADNGSKGKVPTGGTLDAVVASLDNDVSIFGGHVRTEDEVQNHLDETRDRYFPR
jgi:hypothetical protein